MNILPFKDLPYEFQSLVPVLKMQRLLQPANCERMELVKYLYHQIQNCKHASDIQMCRITKRSNSFQSFTGYPILSTFRLNAEEREYRHRMMQLDDQVYGSGDTENWNPNHTSITQIDDDDDYEWITIQIPVGNYM